MINSKVGISIGYFFDLLGFIFLLFSGSFDLTYRSSLAVLEKLKVEIEIQKNIVKKLTSLRSQTIVNDLITGVPQIALGMTDLNSLSCFIADIKTMEKELEEKMKEHREKYTYYFVYSKSHFFGVSLVILGVIFQWYFSVISINGVN